MVFIGLSLACRAVLAVFAETPRPWGVKPGAVQMHPRTDLTDLSWHATDMSWYTATPQHRNSAPR